MVNDEGTDEIRRKLKGVFDLLGFLLIEVRGPDEADDLFAIFDWEEDEARDFVVTD